MRRLRNVYVCIAALIVMAGIAGAGAAQAQAPDEDRPGISIPVCTEADIAMFWHAFDLTCDCERDGWRVERRQWDGGWVTRAWVFTGGDAKVLQTFNEHYWDWTDTSADANTSYTYRVHALNENGTLVSDRHWSRRAPEY